MVLRIDSRRSSSAAGLVVVIPTYCERESLPWVLDRLLSLECDRELQLWVIDDASPDGTGDLVRSEATRDDRLRLVERPTRAGRGAAVIDGLQRIVSSLPPSEAALIVEMDGDGSHDPAHIPALVAAAAEADVVLGSRYVSGGRAELTSARRALSRLANFFAARVLGLTPRDCSTGFRCYRRQALERIDLATLTTGGHATHIELLYRLQRAGLAIGEVPIHYRPRRRGRSKVSPLEVVRVGASLLGLLRASPGGHGSPEPDGAAGVSALRAGRRSSLRGRVW